MAPKIMSKRKFGGSSQAQSSNQRREAYSLEFRSPIQETNYNENFMHKPLILSKTVQFDDFASLGIREMWERIGLLGLCQLSGQCCVRAISLFYANMYGGPKTETLKTYMFGKDLSITPNDINAIIGFSSDNDVSAPYYQSSRKCDFIKEGEGVEFLKMILQNTDIEAFYKPKSKDLNVKARVIHNIITHTILPRDGHRDLVNYMDLYVMQKLYTGRRFNPGCLILSHMREISSTSNKNLGYSALIQKLLVHFQITIPRTESMRNTRKTEKFDKSHLKQMGVIEVDGQWVFKADNIASSLTAPASQNVDMNEALPTPQPPFVERSSLVDPSIMQILEEIREGQRQLFQGQRELLAAQKELHREHGLLSARVHRWMEDQKDGSDEAPPATGDVD